MIGVISADDHAVVRSGIKHLLADTTDLCLVGEASNGVELLMLLQQKPCDVLLLDITMPGKDGLALLKEVHDKWPALAVVILSMHPERQYAARALRSGARGYVTKDGAPEQLVEATRVVARGARYVSPTLAQVLAEQIDQGAGRPVQELLSDREFEVLVRIGEGKTVGEIAEELFLSTNTVSTYRARVLAKLGLNTNADLFRFVEIHHLRD